MGANKLPPNEILAFCKKNSIAPGSKTYRDFPLEQFILLRLKFTVTTNYQRIQVQDLGYIVTAPGKKPLIFTDFSNAKNYKEREINE